MQNRDCDASDVSWERVDHFNKFISHLTSKINGSYEHFDRLPVFKNLCSNNREQKRNQFMHSSKSNRLLFFSLAPKTTNFQSMVLKTYKIDFYFWRN